MAGGEINDTQAPVGKPDVLTRSLPDIVAVSAAVHLQGIHDVQTLRKVCDGFRNTTDNASNTTHSLLPSQPLVRGLFVGLCPKSLLPDASLSTILGEHVY